MKLGAWLKRRLRGGEGDSIPREELKLFELMIRVRPGPECDMPSHLIGGTAICYVGAPDHLTSVRLAVEAIRSKGYIFEELEGQAFKQLDPTKWDSYLLATWGDLPSKVPDQIGDDVRKAFPNASVIRALVQTGGVAFGPMICWERDERDASEEGKAPR